MTDRGYAMRPKVVAWHPLLIRGNMFIFSNLQWEGKQAFPQHTIDNMQNYSAYVWHTILDQTIRVEPDKILIFCLSQSVGHNYYKISPNFGEDILDIEQDIQVYNFQVNRWKYLQTQTNYLYFISANLEYRSQKICPSILVK